MQTSQKGFVASLLLVLIAVLLIGGGLYLYTHKSSTILHASGYEDTSVGFALTIPSAWSDIGYVVDKQLEHQNEDSKC